MGSSTERTPIATTAQLARNMKLFVFVKVFQKRVFLPLAGIYFTTRAGFKISDLGFLFAWFALVQIIVEVPTGYFADRYGKVLSMRIGAFLNIISCFIYVFYANPIGIYIAYTFEATGYSFFGGANEAAIHDTLQAQGKAGQYTKLFSRIQAVSLGINAVLLALVPLTYKVDPRFPFVIGMLMYTLLFIVNLNLTEVYEPLNREIGKQRRSKIQSMVHFKKLLPFFLILGYISSLYTAPSDYINILLAQLGVRPYLLGFMFSAASVFGVIIGFGIHYLKKLSLRQYILFDVSLLLFFFGSLWSTIVPLIIVAFIINVAFWRYRRIVYQAEIYEILPVREKAVLFSVINNSSQIFEFVVPLIFGFIIARSSISVAFGLSGLLAAFITVPLLAQTSQLGIRAKEFMQH